MPERKLPSIPPEKQRRPDSPSGGSRDAPRDYGRLIEKGQAKRADERRDSTPAEDPDA